MSIYFELLDRASGTMLKDYGTEADALEDLRAFGREHGQDHLRGLALLRVADDRPLLVAMDDDLITRVAQSEAVTRRHTWDFIPTVLSYKAKYLPGYLSGQASLAAEWSTEFTATNRWTLTCA